MELLDSRRLTGPNLIWEKCGAVIDVQFSDNNKNVVVLWQSVAERLLKEIGLDVSQTKIRSYPQGASLAISSPIDVLYTATDINEWCWHYAVDSMQGKVTGDFQESAETFKKELTHEANPQVLNIKKYADHHGIRFLRDDDEVSLGLGRYSQTWPVSELPDTGQLNNISFKAIPVGLITGTNGKTTSVRLSAHVVQSAKLNAGISSTDWIAVNDQIIDKGDYSGPGGARRVLRDKRVDVAVLETARGGLLRRGLGVDRADAALITNIAEDHMGEFGVQTLDELADVKWIVTTAIDDSGRVILNADDPFLVARAKSINKNIVWFSADQTNPLVQHSIEQSGWACTVENNRFVYYEKSNRHDLLNVKDVPVTVEGAATHNVLNTLGVIGFTHALGISINEIREGISTFSDKDNPGRCNQFIINDARVIVDFAHNPHGMRAFMTLARNLHAKRKLLVTGQAGDRSDEDIKNLAIESVKGINIDKIIIKKMTHYERGRKPGETAEILRQAYINSGIDPLKIDVITDELDAVNQAINWSRPGDLVLLLIHENRRAVLELLSSMSTI